MRVIWLGLLAAWLLCVPAQAQEPGADVLGASQPEGTAAPPAGTSPEPEEAPEITGSSSEVLPKSDSAKFAGPPEDEGLPIRSEVAGKLKSAEIKRNFAICSDEVRATWTSGSYIRSVAQCVYDANAGTPVASMEGVRLALIEDMYVKAKSYAFLNKFAFGCSVLLGICVLIWPSLVAVSTARKQDREAAIDKLKQQRDAAPDDAAKQVIQTQIDARIERKSGAVYFGRLVLSAASSQTSVTALAALSFAFYTHYKRQQSSVEDLMRMVLHAQTVETEIVSQVLERLREVDRGFQFSAIINTGNGDNGAATAEAPGARSALNAGK